MFLTNQKGILGYMVFRSEPGIISKSFTEFLDKDSILTTLTNMSMIFLILISNIYNTTPNKQILISYLFKNINIKEEDQKDCILEEDENNQKIKSGDNMIKNELILNDNNDEHIEDKSIKESNEKCNHILFLLKMSSLNLFVSNKNNYKLIMQLHCSP